MNNKIVCQYRRENEMDGHLLPTGLLFVLEKSVQDASLLAWLISQTDHLEKGK
jgi:hypothetical protein